MTRFARLAPLALLALSACATVPAPAAAPAPRPQHQGPAAIGQATYVNGPVVTPLALVEDSRCPMNARCVWAGRVILKVRIATGAGSSERDLTLGEPVRVADGMLTLTSVTPERMTNTQIAPGQYRFGFEFQGGL